MMKRQFFSVLCILLILLTACESGPQIAPLQPAARTPTPKFTPTNTPTPAPTWTPTPPPTPTPIPPLVVRVTWPEEVSALEPPHVIVDVTQPQDVAPDIAINAKIYDPTATVYATFDLVRQNGNRYSSMTPLTLSLDAPEGHWWLVVRVDTELDVVGERMLPFTPAPIEFHPLTETLPTGVMVDVPLAFAEVITQGDRYAGGRVWRYGDGEIALWWAPGPTQALRRNNAVVMLEATHDPDAPPEAQLIEQTEWQERTAFLFHEQWPGSQGGAAEAWVIQDKNFWLYVLRVRAVGGETIPPLMREIGATFTFDE